MSHTTSKKRQREQTQRDRRMQKEAHRMQRKSEAPRSHGQEDPDLAGMVEGLSPHKRVISINELGLAGTRSPDRLQLIERHSARRCEGWL